jgi:hypothetical protein
MARRKVDIFSPLILNHLAQLTPQISPLIFLMTLAAADFATALFSM